MSPLTQGLNYRSACDDTEMNIIDMLNVVVKRSKVKVTLE